VQVKLASAMSTSQKPAYPGKKCIDIASTHAEVEQAASAGLQFKNARAWLAVSPAEIGRK